MRRFGVVLLVVLFAALLSARGGFAQSAPPPATAPSPTAAPSPGSSSNPLQNLVQNITQVVHFPAPSISDAIEKVFSGAAEKQEDRIKREAAQWAEIFGEVLSKPTPDFYADLSQKSVPIAGALAAALFLLRLAIHHWTRLAGGDEPLTAVFSDWLVAGLLAVAAGQFLDTLTQTSWWITGYLLGSSVTLADKFTTALSPVAGLYSAIRGPGLFGILIGFGLYVGGLLSVVAMATAFAAANTVLYILAYLGPPVAVVSVIPQMRWLRSLWIKAASIVALLPFVAGAIFDAGVSLGMLTFKGGGLMPVLMNTLWLWGAAGAMLSLAGIVGRITLSAATDAIGKVGASVKGVTNVAALGLGAGAAVATGGASLGLAAAGTAGGAAGGAGAAGAGGGASVASAASAASSAAPDSEIGDLDQAMGHYQNAQRWNMTGAALEAAGLPAGRFFHGLARHEQLGARQHELAARMRRFTDAADNFSDIPAIDKVELTPPEGVHPGVYARALGAYPGAQSRFLQGYNNLKTLLQGTDTPVETLMSAYPEDVGKMVHALQTHQEQIAGADDPLFRAAAMGGATGVLQDFYPAAPSQPAVGADAPPPPSVPDGFPLDEFPPDDITFDDFNEFPDA